MPSTETHTEPEAGLSDPRGAAQARGRSLSAVANRAWRGWSNDSGALLAAGLAFFGALAASPLIVIASAASREIAGKTLSAAEVFDPIAAVVGPKAAGAVTQTVAHSPASGSGSGLLQVAALAFALLAGSGLFVQFRTVLDMVFDFHRPKKIAGLARDLAHGVAATAGVAIVAVGRGLALRAAEALPAASRPAAVMAVQTAFVLVLIVLVPVIYRYLAREILPWGVALRGAAIAVVVASGATLVVWGYFASGWATKVYGPAASVFVALLWLLMLGTGAVLGAEVARAWQLGGTGGGRD